MSVEMELLGVRLDARSNTPVMVLRERGGANRMLSILIGGPEAQAIAFALDGVEPRRPMTHDLAVLLLEELGADIDRIVISALRDSVYYADIVITSPTGSHLVSARPSDAVALSARVQCTIEADEAVLAAAGYVERDEAEDEAGAQGESDEVVEQFKEFIDQVNPEDFAS